MTYSQNEQWKEDDKAVNAAKRGKHRINYMGIGIVAGTAFGISLGGAVDSVGMGIALGIGTGAAIGSAFNKKQA